ncbi:hypothetical protein ACKWTF_000100 [Chironomus riparius]
MLLMFSIKLLSLFSNTSHNLLLHIAQDITFIHPLHIIIVMPCSYFHFYLLHIIFYISFHIKFISIHSYMNGNVNEVRMKEEKNKSHRIISIMQSRSLMCNNQFLFINCLLLYEVFVFPLDVLKDVELKTVICLVVTKLIIFLYHLSLNYQRFWHLHNLLCQKCVLPFSETESSNFLLCHIDNPSIKR